MVDLEPPASNRVPVLKPFRSNLPFVFEMQPERRLRKQPSVVLSEVLRKYKLAVEKFRGEMRLLM